MNAQRERFLAECRRRPFRGLAAGLLVHTAAWALRAAERALGLPRGTVLAAAGTDL